MSDHEQRPSRIPDFQSREEEAEFWDTHDFTDYLDELEQVQVKFAENLSNLTEGFTVRLSPQDVQAIQAKARQKGIGASTLVRMWIYEHLQEEGTNARLNA